MENLLIIPFMFSIIFVTYFALRLINYLKERKFRKPAIMLINSSDKDYFLRMRDLQLRIDKCQNMDEIRKLHKELNWMIIEA